MLRHCDAVARTVGDYCKNATEDIAQHGKCESGRQSGRRFISGRKGAYSSLLAADGSIRANKPNDYLHKAAIAAD